MLSALRQDPGSSFSDLWYRLGPSRPRLSVHARVARQRFGSEGSYVVEDPAGGQYYRLSDAAYFFLALLDGRRSVDDAWQACNARLGDAAPTQRECADLLAKLRLFGLMGGDVPLSAEMIELRRREAGTRRLRRRAGLGLSLTIPLVNPEPWLERGREICRGLFSGWALAAWSLVVGFALYSVFRQRSELASQLNGVLDPSNLLWLSASFLALRALHELGHAAACKAMGGRCTEIGLMIIALILPFPYCDTSSAWRLPEVWRRVVVSAGGMLFETFIAGLAAIAWAWTDEPGLARTLLYNVMLISGVTTLVFNLNPLLRYDGYYILSDVAGSANLAGRSQELLRFLVQRTVLGVRSARPPSVRDASEFWLLLVYGVLSWPYRLLIAFAVIMVLWSNPAYLTLGAVLAAAATLAWLVWPALRTLGFLATSPLLLGRRARAWAIAVASVGGVGLLLGVVPAPAAGYATGIIEPVVDAPLRATEDGFVEAIHAAVGDRVSYGQPLVTLRNAELQRDIAAADAAMARAAAQLDAASAAEPRDRVVMQARLDRARAALARFRDRRDALTVRAAADGVLVASGDAVGDLAELEGRFLVRGTRIASVAQTEDLIVRCLVSDRDQAYIFRAGGAEGGAAVRATIRVRGDAWRELDAHVLRVAPAASRRVTDPALATSAGGDVLLDPSDPEGHTSVVPQFVVEVAPTAPPSGWQPGLRARVRFGVPAEPLGSQWGRRFRQYLSDKVGM